MTVLPKGRAKAEREERKRQEVLRDLHQSKRVRKRARRRCELCGHPIPAGTGQVHHKLRGGLRGRGDSALARNKLHVCGKCHRTL